MATSMCLVHEHNVIDVTTQYLRHDQRRAMGAIKKIPKPVLSRCEWGHDNYTLKSENLPKAPAPSGRQGLEFS
ncbi:MAG: hypothetical protein OJF50_004295 [Nitrospira sp.]|nr:hypothetical protein [Nitrospira sp.]